MIIPLRILLTGVVSVFCILLTVSRVSAAPVDTLHILALRVDFKLESDATQTTGDGSFLFDKDGWDNYILDLETYPYDPPPHNGAYFETHLRAAQQYFRAVSYGAQELVWDMPDSILHLPRMMREYYSKHRSVSLESSDVQLIGIIKDVFAALDSSFALVGTTFSLRTYDAFIIFHAGADGRTDLDDGTYSDIPSKYISLAQYHDSVVVSDGTVIRDAILMPETVTQDSRIGVLNAALAYEIGHQLGLPNLFYTDPSSFYGVPAVGSFSLMDIGARIPDSGATYIYGTIPPLPGPWERIYKGWVTPIVLSSEKSGTYSINPAALTADSSIYKIPISDHEYFLIENRQKFLGAVADSPYVRDTLTGVIMGPAPVVEGTDTVYGYDALLPGSGLLIWHIDERQMDITSSPMVINYDIQRQGIDIVEADGLEELGYVFTYGSATDLFRPSASGEPDAFTPFTKPSTVTRSGAYTGISIEHIDTLAAYRMRFTVSFSGLKKGWPLVLDSLAGTLPPVCGDITGRGKSAVFVASESGVIYAWQADGTGLLDTVSGLFAYSAAPPAGAPALGDVDGNDTSNLVIADVAGTLHVFSIHDDTLAQNTIWLGAAATGHPVLAPTYASAGLSIYSGTRNGQLHMVYNDTIRSSVSSGTFGPVWCAVGLVHAMYGSLSVVVVSADAKVRLYSPLLDTLYWETDLGAVADYAPVIGDLNRDNSSEIIIQAEGQLYCLSAQGALVAGWPVGAGLTSAPALADLNSNGYLDVFVSGTDFVYGFNQTGALLSGYPRPFKGTSSVGKIMSAPVIGNVDAALGDELVLGSPLGDIYMFEQGRQTLKGWPLATGGNTVQTSILLCDLEEDDTTTIVAVTGGSIYAWDMLVVAKGQWPMEAHDNYRSGYYGALPVDSAPAGDLLSVVYNYPNPVKTDKTVIRYRVGAADAIVTIKIFDYAGALVTTRNGPNTPFVYNESVWDVTHIQSGVYYCRVEAKSALGKQIRFCRIAVIK